MPSTPINFNDPAKRATFLTWLTNNAAGLGDQAAADLANAPSAKLVWQTAVPKPVIDALVIKSAYTPADPADNTVLYQNRAMNCQLKQFNCNWLTQGPGAIDASIAQERTNFSDCMTQIPSGAGTTVQNAGWGLPASPGAVRAALQRLATAAEALYTTVAPAGPGNVTTDPRASATNPDLLDMEGPVTAQQVAEVRNPG